MIRGTKKHLADSKPTVGADLRAAIHNRFDIEVVDAKTGEVKNKAVAYNVICDKLWTKLLSTSPLYFSYIHYGGGTGAPSTTDTKLFSFIGYGSATFDENDLDVENGVYWLRKKLQLSETTAVGETITEIGIAHSTSSSSLCTHAMLQDMNGNPVSITKTDTDVINIYATVYVHWNQNATGDGSLKVYKEKGYVLWDRDINKYGRSKMNLGIFDWLTGVRGISLPLYYMRTPTAMDESRTISNFTPVPREPSSISYDPDNKRLTAKFARFTVDSDNVDRGIRNVTFPYRTVVSSSSESQFAVYSLRLENGSAPVRSTIVNEAIGTGDGVTTNFRTKFGFAHNATIYVDGVPASGVTVDERSAAYTKYLGPSFVYLPEHSTCAIRVSLLSTSSWGGIYAGDYSTWYNPYWEEGFTSFSYSYSGHGVYIKCSDDLVSWDEIAVGDKPTAIPEEYQHRKYWRIGKPGDILTDSSDLATGFCNFATPADVLNNVHFDTPPAEGAVITADYVSDTIAKDENHVFDLTITIQLGEYTED